MKKFFDKTKNDWNERDDFEKVNGKYDWVKMDYSADEVDNKGEKNKDKKNKKPEKEKVNYLLFIMSCYTYKIM